MKLFLKLFKGVISFCAIFAILLLFVKVGVFPKNTFSHVVGKNNIETNYWEVKSVNSISDDNDISKDVLVNWALKESRNISRRLLTEIVDEAFKTKYGLLILAIAKNETNFDISANSKAGAVGLMQIMPKIWTEELITSGIIAEERDLYDPILSIRSAEYILDKFITKHNSMDKVLNAYVGGSDEYVNKVQTTLGELYIKTWSVKKSLEKENVKNKDVNKPTNIRLNLGG